MGDVDEDAEDAVGIAVVRAADGRPPRPHLDPPLGDDPRPVRRRQLLQPTLPEGVPPERRFQRAVAASPRRGAAPEHVEVLEELATAPVRGMGRVPYASNAVFLLELDAPAPDGEGRLRAVYKPRRGERPLWDFPQGTLHFREVAAYVVDAALGFGVVPPTTLRDGPHGPGSVQLVIDVADEAPRGAARRRVEPALLALAALDALINNADRKSAHLLVSTEGRLYGIDHGLSFLPYPRQRTALLGLGGSLLPDPVAEAVRALAADGARRGEMLSHLALLLAPAEVRATAARLDELAADPAYPELDPWDGRPFEWW